MSIFRFYYCEYCGVMNIKNFIDDNCPVCKVRTKVRAVEVSTYSEIETTLSIINLPAPHTEK